uniref:MFS transporter n=1 Tax=Geobacter metallireducens TaxID=28232 RepID=A0A831U1Q8_GEOME
MAPAAGQSVSGDTRWLLTLCGAQVFIMLVFMNYSAIVPQLKAEWKMTNTMAGTIFSVYQFGYILSGVLLSTLTDRFSTKYIFLVSAIWSCVANILFALHAHDYSSGLLLRGLTGIGMGGTYMPGLKLVAERFPSHKRGTAVGIYVGALMLGTSLSLAVTGGLTSHFGWRRAIGVCSAGVLVGILLAFPVFRGYRHHPRQAGGGSYGGEVFGNRPALLMIGGYGAHMWEMYGMRSWVAPFFTAQLLSVGLGQADATAWGSLASAAVVGIGTVSTAMTGKLSDRWGRTRTISVVMLGSACCSFTFGWLHSVSIPLTLAVGLLYGYLVVAESPVFSTGLTELVSSGYLGSAMGVQSLAGYTMGMISPTVFGWALDLCQGWHPWPGIRGDWGIAFATAGIGALGGPVCMALLRRDPASRRMAGGRQ